MFTSCCVVKRCHYSIVLTCWITSPFFNEISRMSFFTEGLAWDWINKKIYWTDYCQDEIEVYDPVSNYRRVLTSTGTSPYSIVVDPGTG